MQDYDSAYRDEGLEVGEFFNFGFDVVDRWAEDRTKLALISVDSSGEQAQQHTFWDLKVQSNRFANVLRGLGVKKGDRVLVMLPQWPEWYAAMLGMTKLGVIPMPTTTLCTAGDIEYRVNRAEAVAAVTDPENAAKVEQAAASCPSLRRLVMVRGTKRGWLSYDEKMPEASPDLRDVESTRSDDPLLIYFTSGTVGVPQDGVAHPGVLRHRPRPHGQVLARPEAHGPPVDPFRHRLGQGRLRQAVRAVDPGGGRAATRRQGQVQRATDPADGGRLPGDVLLRSSHGLPDDGPGGPDPLPDAQSSPLHQRRRAPEPGGDAEVGRRHRPDYLRRLRADGNGAAGGQLPVHARPARLHGKAHAGVSDIHRGRRGPRASGGGGGADRRQGETGPAGGAVPGVLEGHGSHGAVLRGGTGT